MDLNRFCTLLILFALGVWYLPAASQDGSFRLETDTLLYDKDFEYIAAFEMDKYMESYVFYHTALEAYVDRDYFSAKAAVSRAIKMNKKETKFRMLKAWILSKELSYKKAIKYTTRILEKEPDHQEALYCKAINQYFMKDFLGANMNYGRLLELDVSDVRAYYGRAEAKMEMGDYQGAIADYNNALALKAEMVLAYQGRGLAYFRMFEYHMAVKDFNQFLVAQPESGKIYYYRGLSYLRLNEFASACQDFEKALLYDYKDAREYFSKYCDF